MIVGLVILVFLFLYFSDNLLLSLIVLELLSFFVLYFLITSLSFSFFSDCIVLIFFSVFVMEGVMALSGLIILVSYSGSDYLKSSSILKC